MIDKAKLKAWAKHALTDAAHWTRAVLGCVSSAVVQMLQGVTVEAIEAWTPRQWALHLIYTLAPLLLALKAGERNPKQAPAS